MNLLSAIIETKRAEKLSLDSKNEMIEKRLHDIVTYAKKNSPYFFKLYKNLGDEFELCEIPPTNKVEMMNNFDEWITDSNISMFRIKEFIKDIDNVGRLLDEKYLVFMTSGSTGNPATVLYDKTSIAVANAVGASRMFARKQDYYTLLKKGIRSAGIFASYGFYLSYGLSRYMSLKTPLLNNVITIDINSPTQEIVTELNDFNPALLSGYPTNLSILCDHQKSGDLNIHPSTIITSGEHLTNSIRKDIANTFKCSVQTHYSSTESGVIACECEYGKLHINDDWVIVEAVDENNKPVPDGTMSHKVLITNLSNYIQPFVRYEMTDRVIIHSDLCDCKKTSKWIEVEGRSDDILIFQNNIRISPMSLYKIIEENKEIKSFQLIQKNQDLLELRIIANDRLSAFKLANRDLKVFLKNNDIDVEIIFSEEAPKAHPVSGKFKHVFSEIE